MKMNKQNKLFATAAMLGLSAISVFAVVSCQKDDDNQVDLTAVIADKPTGDAKVSIDEDRYACWVNGDRVSINGEEYTVGVTTSGSSSVSITGVAYNENGYAAVYPASCHKTENAGSTSAKIILPDAQEWDENHIVTPMVAYTTSGGSGSTLLFHNPCNLLRVTVTNSLEEALFIHQIVATSTNTILTGEASVTGLDGTPTISSVTGGTKDVTLKCGDQRVSPGEANAYTFYVTVPKVSGEQFRFRVLAKTSGGTKYTFDQESQAGITLTENQMVPISISLISSNANGDNNFWGSGSSSDPFLITDLSDLDNFRVLAKAGTSDYITSRSVYYRQTSDIDASENTWDCSGSSNKFYGHYDGGNHYIKLKLSSTNGGLFNNLQYATIENLTLKGTWSGSSSAKGAFCNQIWGESGVSDKTIFINCKNEINVSGTNSVGGFVGGARQYSHVSFTRCTNSGTITGSSDRVGGFVGELYSSSCIIEDCINDGPVSGAGKTGGMMGGCGNSVGPITIKGTVINLKTVSSTAADVGGIIGYPYGGTVTIASGAVVINKGSINTSKSCGYVGGIVADCYNFVCNGQAINKGKIQGNGYVGGIVGNIRNTGTIANCINDSLGVIDASGSYVGGIVGYGAGTEITSCSNNKDVNGLYHVGGIAGAVTGNKTISLCSNSGNVVATSNSSYDACVGGIVGNIVSGTRSVDQCINSGTIEAKSGGSYVYAGGIVGVVKAGTTTVTNCAVKDEDASADNPTIKGNYCMGIGGIVGCNKGGLNVINSYFQGYIKPITKESIAVGGITTSNNTGAIAITNCYFYGTIETTYATGCGDMAFRYNNKGSCSVTTSYSSTNVSKGSYAHHANYSISLTDDNYVTNNSSKKLVTALNDGRSTYNSWTTPTKDGEGNPVYTELPILSWED